jgi:hypothetical protein
VTEVDGQEMTQALQTDAVSALSGRVAGVQISSSTNMGGSSRILIRGANSITQNNQPLFIVDGIPMDNSNYSSSGAASGRGGIDYGNLLKDLNPDEWQILADNAPTIATDFGVDLGTVEGVLQAIFVFVVATFAMLLFAAATQGYFLARSRIYESAALLVVAFTLFVPNVWLDMVQSPFRSVPPAEFETVLGEVDDGTQLRLLIAGPDFNTGAAAETTLVMTAEGTSAAERIQNSGLLLFVEGDTVRLDEPMFGTATAEKLADFDFYSDTPVAIAAVQVPQNRLPSQVFYVPALALLALVILMQRRRQTKPAF